MTIENTTKHNHLQELFWQVHERDTALHPPLLAVAVACASVATNSESTTHPQFCLLGIGLIRGYHGALQHLIAAAAAAVAAADMA